MKNQTTGTFELQPTLENELLLVKPLKSDDFETLYQVASDPLIWEQHPNKNRYKKEIFQTFFVGAIDSKGAFLVIDKKTGEQIGSSRYTSYDSEKKSISIGYTFLSRTCWGKPYNKALKTLMLDHAFRFIETVYFQVGANNIRSQKAMEKLGAEKIREEEITYYGEAPNLNFIYRIEKKKWNQTGVSLISN
jgi:RimJ/RimL family protein N-acetyltransferase